MGCLSLLRGAKAAVGDVNKNDELCTGLEDGCSHGWATILIRNDAVSNPTSSGRGERWNVVVLT